MTQPTTRAQVVTRRTYNRPLDEAGTVFETWEQTVNRVIAHQRWLWERAKGYKPLTAEEELELLSLKKLMNDRKVSVSGRTLWLGGTDIAKTREASQFNCSFGKIETVHDVVDAFWLLLQGCGVGFEPVVGTLNGFAKPVDIVIRRSEKVIGDPKGGEHNELTIETTPSGDRVAWLVVGDSAEAWAKAVGKILALKEPIDKLIIDFREVRAAGIRLKGYGWISSGDETISVAFKAICEIMNKRAGQLLSCIDILDILNWLGTTLSSRRSAEIAVMPVSDPEIDDFITAKKDFWLHGNEHRQQSNNSIMFHAKPTKKELRRIFDMMIDSGGSEPGFINAETAKKRAPWFKGVNPCAEILLGNKSFCNLVEVDWGKYAHEDMHTLLAAVNLTARANYRQTCVNLDDGILQRSWHELNEFLRLCGVGATGIVKALDVWGDNAPAILRDIADAARKGAYSMADELGLPRPKAVTTVKPSGTLSKIMDTTEGVHRPLGRYIFNNVTFSKHDPIVEKMKAAGYRVFDKPFEKASVLITFPVAYEDVEFTEELVGTGVCHCGFKLDGDKCGAHGYACGEVKRKVYVNKETAVEQLERYKLLMDNYVDHNCSVTISYSVDEVDDIVDWIYDNWDSYVGVSFILRNDPTKTAADLGYAYLPQEVVTEDEYREYVSQLKPVNLDDDGSLDLLADEGCAGGACPIR